MAQPTGRSGFEPAPDAATRRALLDITRINANNAAEAATKMEWRGVWETGDYDFNDVVRDSGWAMVCIEPDGCTEKPAPQPTGSEFFIYTGAEPTVAPTVPQVVYGNRYTINAGGYLNGYRVWTVIGNSYTIYVVSEPAGAEPVIQQLVSFIAQAAGWREFRIDPAIVYEVTFDLVAVVGQPDPAPTTFTGDWNYITPNNAGIPASGQVSHADKARDSLRVHKTDTTLTDRSADLATVSVGDTIELGTTLWSVQATTDSGTYYDFSVAPASQHNAVGGGSQAFTFTVETDQPVTYIEDTNYWLSNFPGEVQGLVGEIYDTATLNDNAYGVDLIFQEALVSGQWQVISTPSGAVGGGSINAAEVGTFVIQSDPGQWNDLRVPLNATKVGPTQVPGFAQWRDDGAGSAGVFAYAFSPSTEEQVFFDAQMPHQYAEGTRVAPHVHFTVTSTPTVGQTIRFGFEYTWSNVGEVFPQTTIIYAEYTFVSGDAAYQQYIGGFDPDIVEPSMKVSATISGRFFRDASHANDTYTQDVVAIEFDFHYLAESLGSNNEFSK